MRRVTCWMLLLSAFFFPPIMSRATEEHLLTVYQALATSAEDAIGPVTYVTWYGALEETTMEAICWPAVLASPHKDAMARDLNWASMLGIVMRECLETDSGSDETETDSGHVQGEDRE